MLSNNLIRMCAAGSGKTWGICSDALNFIRNNPSPKRILILTYTNRGVEAIEWEIKKQNHGVIPSKINIQTWYSFLLIELIKPHQTYLFQINEVESIDFSAVYGQINYFKKGNKNRYINKNKDLKSNFVAELAIFLNDCSSNLVIKRLEQIYSHIFIDEVQDMAGYDLDIIALLMKSNINIICVGDNKQATFKTNTSIKNKKKSGKNIWEFFWEQKSKNIATIEENLVSRRFNESICNFANLVYPNANNMTTSMSEKTNHDGIFFVQKCDIETYYMQFQPIILRYDSRTDVGNFNAMNFGESKGLTFNRIIIFPNKQFEQFLFQKKALGAPQKYYVAVTRPKYSIAFVVDSLPKGDCYEQQVLNIEGKTIFISQLLIEVNQTETIAV